MSIKVLPYSPVAVLLPLFFLSGATGLMFQALWMRELSLLFGSTAQAAAAALAAFFLGLAAGGAFWGQRCLRVRRPLRTYGRLELAVAGAALGLFALLPAFHWLYGLAYDGLVPLLSEDTAALLTASKLGLALLLLFPAAFFMGGTLPVVSQHLVPAAASHGMRLPLVYAVNTAGAAAGAFAAAFVLPQALGWRWTYGAAVLGVAAVGLAALWLDRRSAAGAGAAAMPAPGDAPRPQPETAAAASQAIGAGAGIDDRMIRALAFLSGFCALGLEVLWTRMFAQVLHNSVYSFAAILICFLLALAAGSMVAGRLAAGPQRPMRPLLALLLSLTGLAVAASPWVFALLTDGLGYLGVEADWSGYLGVIFGHAALVVLPPALLLGILFPLLLRIAAPRGRSVGATVGRLVALNTLGAIAGSLAAGFVLLDWLGLWRSIQFLAGSYLAAALVLLLPAGAAVADAGSRRVRAAALLPIAGLLGLISVLDAGRLPVVRVDPLGRGESLYQVWEGSGGVVAVVRRGDALAIKVDNHYRLGSTAGRGFEERQAHFPLLLHDDPQRVFFIGLGTGITAGAALRHPVAEVVAAELLADAITAARTYFAPWQNGLFEDPRARILAVDGRNHLAAAPDRFDVVIGDLFVPWKAGTGSLYTLEHFRNVRERLRPGGLFAQWLPLYQLTAREFGIIAHTFLEAFPEVTLWRGDFLPNGPIVALVGRTEPASLEPTPLLARASALSEGDRDRGIRALLPEATPPLLLYYAGNLGRTRELFAHWPLNTDARPVIELEAPRSQRQVAAGEADWFTGEALIAFFEQLLADAPPETDPYLAALSPEQRAAVRVGLKLFRQRAENGGNAPPGQGASSGRSREARGAGRALPGVQAPASGPASGQEEPAPPPAVEAMRAQLEALRAQRDAVEQRLQAIDE